MKLQDRLKSLRKNLGYTQETIALKLGIKRASYASYEEGRAIPRLNILKHICDLAGANIEDIIGDDLDKVKPTGTFYSGSTIPLIPIKASAGYHRGFPDGQFVSELPQLHIPLLGHGNFRAFEISGDSMLPLVSGTIVIGERIENISSIKNGKTYILVIKNEGIVYKRVFNYINENGMLYLVSDNKLFKPFSISPDEIAEVWSAKAYLSLDFPERNISSKLLTEGLS